MVLFGVSIGKFLGYMLSERGIELNPNKYQAIFEIGTPNIIIDI